MYRLNRYNLIRGIAKGSFCLIFLIGNVSCGDGIVNPYEGFEENWLDWEFDEKFAVQMEIDNSFLYVAAASKGIWRIDIRNDSEWEYLGLSDSSLGDYTNLGAVDLDVLDGDILVAYYGQEPRNTSVGIWRSSADEGFEWMRSDSGIPESIADTFEANSITGIERSPHNPDIVIAVKELIIYRSTDNGASWNHITGPRGTFTNWGSIKWNPYQYGEVWFWGITSLFEPYFGSLAEFGLKPNVGVDFYSLGIPNVSVGDVAFNRRNPETIYSATNLGPLTSTDGGKNWKLEDSWEGGSIRRMIGDPENKNSLYY